MRVLNLGGLLLAVGLAPIIWGQGQSLMPEKFERKRALLLGISEQDSFGALQSVSADMEILEKGLTGLGFTVERTAGGRLNRTQVLESIAKFKEGSRPGDFMLVFISGHGFQYRNAQYLASTEFKDPSDKSILPEVAIPVNRVLELLGDASFAKGLIIFDICRNQLVKGTEEDLVTPQSPQRDKLALMFSTGARDAVPDRSVLAPNLLEQIAKPQLLKDALSATREAVYNSTKGRLNPVVAYDLTGSIYLARTSDDPMCAPVIRQWADGGLSDETYMEYVRRYPACRDAMRKIRDNGAGATGLFPAVPHGINWSRAKDGSLSPEVFMHWVELKRKVDWVSLPRDYRALWEDFETRNAGNPQYVTLLLEELVARKATMLELFNALVSSEANTNDGYLKNMEKMRVEAAKKAGRVYTPLPVPFVKPAEAASKDPELIGTFTPPDGIHGVELLGKQVPWGEPESSVRIWWEYSSKKLSQAEMDWLLYEARSTSLNLSDLMAAAGPKELSRPFFTLLNKAQEVRRVRQEEERTLSSKCLALQDRVLKSEKPAELESDVQEFVYRNSNNGCAYYVRGCWLWRKNEYAASARDLGRALSLGYDSGRLRNRLGIYFFQIGDSASSLEHFKKYSDMVPESTEALLNISEIYLHEEMFDQAERIANRALEVAENTLSDARKNSSDSGKDNDKEALKSAEQTFARVTRQADVIKSAIMIGRGNKTEAEELFHKDPALPAGEYEPHEYRCWANAFLGDPQAALDDCDRANAFNPIEALSYRAHALFRIGNYDAAMDSIDKTLKRMPDSGLYHFQRGLILSALGKRAEAQIEYEDARNLGYKFRLTTWIREAFAVVPARTSDASGPSR
jgi:tetratricopeptide (TPR) repeat protein